MKAMLKALVMTSLLMSSMTALAKTQEEQKECQDKIEAKKQELRKALDQFELGEVTMLEVTDAKLGVADQVYACGSYVKYNYCKYKLDLLNYKLRLASDSNAPTAPIEDAIVGLVDYCVHPGAHQ